MRTGGLLTIGRANSCFCCCDFFDCGVVTLNGISPPTCTANVPMVAGDQDRLGRPVGVRSTQPAAAQMVEPTPSGTVALSERLRQPLEESVAGCVEPAQQLTSGSGRAWYTHRLYGQADQRALQVAPDGLGLGQPGRGGVRVASSMRERTDISWQLVNRLGGRRSCCPRRAPGWRPQGQRSP